MIAVVTPPPDHDTTTPSAWLTCDYDGNSPDYQPDPADGVWSDDCPADDTEDDWENLHGCDSDPETDVSVDDHLRRSSSDSPNNDQTSTPVHPPQTNVVESTHPLSGDATGRSDVDYRFRRPDHRLAYTRTLAVLSATYRHADRAKRLQLCGAHATVWHSPSTDTVAVRAYHCGMRCCPRCRETHSAQTRERLNRFLQGVDHSKLSMITLTLAHTDDPLSAQIDHLYASFRRLRASKLWRRYRPKGYAVCEVVRSTDGLQWHPHLHLLAETPYIPDDALKAAWLKATGTSHIVDIRRINRKSIDRHRDYLCTYLTKPPDAAVLNDPALLLEWIDAFSGRHVLIKFGKPTIADKPPPPEDPQDWSLIGSLTGLLAGLERGDKRAIHWLARIGKGPTVERRDTDAGKDYSIDLAYHTPDTPQWF